MTSAMTAVSMGRTLRQHGRCAALFAVAVGVVVAGTLGAPASADTPDSHDPFGNVESVRAPSADTVQFSGWAAEPDALTSNATVVGLVDGAQVVSAVTSVVRPKVQRYKHTGPTPGFVLPVPVPVDDGVHVACLAVANVGEGRYTVLRCAPVPLGTDLTADQLAARNPQGNITHVRAAPASMHVTGWTADPDFISRRLDAVLYVDGAPVATVMTGPSTPAMRAQGAGPRSAIDITVPVGTGAHVACLWVVNLGLGQNALLGCYTRDTRGSVGRGEVIAPPVNAKIVTEARKHIGQPYVWGAAGPDRFDCSGLVKYSYSKFDLATPRVSQDQFTAARRITAARAVPGDLVFSYDGVGDVYHVGIYTGPGMTVAAIDEDRGVDNQPIWDPSMVSYGSFTHT